MSELPPGWIKARLGDVCEVNPSGFAIAAITDTDLVSFVPMQAMSEITGEIESAVDRPFAQVRKGFTRFTVNDVLFAKITPSMENGKSAVARRLTNDAGCGSTEFHVLRPLGGMSAEYVWRFVRQKAFRDGAKAVMSGAVGQQRVPAEHLRQHSIALAPLAEQRRIVARLNELLGRTARARKELDRVPKLIEQYKQVVLGHAYDELAKTSGLQSLGQAAIELRYGTARKCRASSKGVAVLRIPNVGPNGLDLSDLKYAELDKKELDRLRLREGDLLVIRSNGSPTLVGRAAQVRDREAGLAYAGYLIRIRLDHSRADPGFIARMLQAPAIRQRIETGARSTSGVHNINSEELAALPLPLPELKEQREVIRRIDWQFAQLDRLAAEHGRADHLLPRLEQALLTKAFRGELVPQNPNDEPASAMLERIRAKRAAEPPRTRQQRAASQTPTSRAPRRQASMTKNRQDPDVKLKPYLARHLRDAGGSAKVEDLFRRADLPVADFYKQLAWEVEAGHVRDQGPLLAAA